MKSLAAIFLATGLAVLPFAANAETPRAPIERLAPVMLNGKPLPFSAGVRVGDILYLSGQIGAGADGKLPDGLEAQARNALDRIGSSLQSQKLDWKDIFRCSIFLSDMKNWPAFNAVYATYVDPAHLPARSAFGTSGLALGALVEVQCDAYDPAK